MADPVQSDLPERLRTATRALHAQAERAGIMKALLCGSIGQPAYCALLRNLHAIYAALEPALTRHAAHPCLAPFTFAPLHRCEALAADLRTLHGARWADDFPLQPACETYVTRIRAIDATSPERLLAHAYARYLGDLSGGQLLRRSVAGALRLADGSGVAFYEFGDAAGLAAAFRAALSRIAADAKTTAALIDEAKLSFLLHVRLFDELDATPPAQAAESAH